MEAKLKHLEFIQKVITRMNTNSFFLKGWTTTLVSALFALVVKDANPQYVYIAWIVIPTFWILDGFFLSQERQYRELYHYVTQLPPEQIDFNMNAKSYDKDRNRWLPAIFSRTLILFYLGLLIVTIIVALTMSGQLFF